MAERNFGYIPSVMDGTEHVFAARNVGDLPEEYSFRSYMAPIIDQGYLSICVPCSVSAYLNWKENLKDGNAEDNKIALMDIYNSKTTEGDGMTFKDALHYLRHNGVESKDGNLSIKSYGLVRSVVGLKYALILNGPCVGALRVYSDCPNFWDSNTGTFLGCHAISIVGYDEKGFIIRNSWGENWGDKGYTHMDYDDFPNFLELWTIME